jgi:hypothetical protein
MHFMTETPARRLAGTVTRMHAWVGRRQRELSDWVHAAGDECARQHGWEITESTGRFGFGARSYRDPRFSSRRWQLERRSAEDPISGWIDVNDRWNEASDYQVDWEPGE